MIGDKIIKRVSFLPRSISFLVQVTDRVHLSTNQISHTGSAIGVNGIPKKPLYANASLKLIYAKYQHFEINMVHFYTHKRSNFDVKMPYTRFKSSLHIVYSKALHRKSAHGCSSMVLISFIFSLINCNF